MLPRMLPLLCTIVFCGVWVRAMDADHRQPSPAGSLDLTRLVKRINSVKYDCAQLRGLRSLGITKSVPFIYLHLPKTAGTAVREYFRHSLPSNNTSINICDDLSLPQQFLKSQHFSVMENCSVVVAHVPYGIVDGLNEALHPVYGVMLRDPLSRTLSLYHYVLRNPGHYQHSHFANVSLHELVQRSVEQNSDGSQDANVAILVRNRMTWWLCGHRCDPSKMSLAEALERAMENLLFNISIVGVSDHTPSFLRVLSHAIDWIPKGMALERVNTAKGRTDEDVEEEDITTMKGLLSADRFLYRLARRLTVAQDRCLRTRDE